MNIFSLVPRNLPFTPSFQFIMDKGITALLIFSLTLTMGCSYKYINRSFQPIPLESLMAVSYWPPIGEETITQIGDPMMRTFLVPMLPAIQLNEQLVHIADYRSDLKMKLEIDPGILKLAGTDGKGGQYFASESWLRLSHKLENGFMRPDMLRGGVYISTAGDMSIYWFWEDVGYYSENASMAPIPPFQYTISTIEDSPQEARFRRELVYSGTDQSALSILYREFIDDLARPAFSQDLKYDLNHGNIIGYKNARFDVLDVGNTSITYKVISPLELDAE